jgi:uncharacterized protein (TIGR02145 family)
MAKLLDDYEQAVSLCKDREYEKCKRLAHEVGGKLKHDAPNVTALLVYANFHTGQVVEAKIAYERLLRITPPKTKTSAAFKPFLTLGEKIESALEKKQRDFEQEQERKQAARMRQAEKAVQQWAENEEQRQNKMRSQSKSESYFYFKARNKVGTKEAFGEFMKSFPESTFVSAAKRDIKKLEQTSQEDILRSIRTQYYEPLTDSRDGQTYKTIILGNKIIMAENLNYDGGDSYPNNVATRNTRDEKRFGRLYTWDGAKKSCPDGWELPSTYTFADIFADLALNFKNRYGVNPDKYTGQLLKSRYSWGQRNAGYDSFGFSALATGYGRQVDEGWMSGKKATYFGVGREARFWTITEKNKDIALYVGLLEASYFHEYEQARKTMLGSVRCVKKNSYGEAQKNSKVWDSAPPLVL